MDRITAIAILIMGPIYFSGFIAACTGGYEVRSQTVCQTQKTVWECHKQGFMSRKIVKICTDEFTCKEKCGEEYK